MEAYRMEVKRINHKLKTCIDYSHTTKENGKNVYGRHKTHTCASRSSLLADFLSRIALPFALRASNWSDNVFSRAFSAFVLWILSIKTRLFLNTLPFTFMYMSWYMCLSIFFASRYFLNRRRRTRIRLNHRIFEGSLASLVPRLLPIIEKTEYLEIFCAIY